MTQSKWISLVGLFAEQVKDDFYMDQLSVTWTSSANISHGRLNLYFSSLLRLSNKEFSLRVKGTACTVKFSATYTQTGNLTGA